MEYRYKQLSPETEQRILEDRAAGKVNPWSFRDGDALRRDMSRDKNITDITIKLRSFPFI